jgi:hypothetical protein
MKNLGGQIKAS